MKKERLFTNRQLLTLLWPLIIEQMLEILVGMADTVMVTTAGEAAVSGVSLVDGLNMLLIQIFAALSTGGAVVVSQYLGRREAEQAVREFQFALRPWPKRELRLCVRPERAACLASFLSGELKLSVSTPPEHAFLTQPPAGAVLLGSGILCRLYPQHPSLCLDTPVLHQQLFSTHLPFAGIRGTANLLSALYPLLTEDV